jgi:hypothetical protein
MLANIASIFSFSSELKHYLPKFFHCAHRLMIFLRAAISTCVCGGIVKNEPAEAPRSIETTAKPFLTLYEFCGKQPINALQFELHILLKVAD